MRMPLLVTIALLGACASSSVPAPQPAPTPSGAAAPATPAPGVAPAPGPATDRATRHALIASDWPLTGRAKPVASRHAMVVSGHPLASDVGVAILRRGGNAVDAAVAVAFALAVVEPVAGNIGGGGFMLIRDPGGTVRALDYREAAPRRATPGMYVDSTGKPAASSLTGHPSVAVPGSVAGLWEAHRKYGKLPWRALVAPAIALARDGHVLDGPRSHQIAREASRLARFPASRAQFLRNGEAPPAGTRFVQAELARTLELIADSGPKVFYRGQIADLMVREMERGGGLITRDDLGRYRAKWRAPLQIDYRGYTVYTMPPPSGGGVTLAEILNTMEGFGPLPAFGSARLLHLQAEAMRRAYADRNAFLGDPDFVALPLKRLVSKSYAAELRAAIDPGRATGTTSAPVVEAEEDTSTTHYSIVDADGGAVSCTTTLNNDFGSAVTVTGAGFLLNDEMDDFATAPGKPNLYGLVQGEANAIAPGKRMLSAMTPSIVLDTAGNLQMVVGTPGGPTIITSVAQVILNVLDQRMSLPDAVAAPRIHHQALPDQTYYERAGLTDTTVRALEAMGHKMEMRRGHSGVVAAIQKTAGGWVGVSDPRTVGGAIGY